MNKAEALIRIVESSLSRIFNHIEKGGNFGIMSAFRAETNDFQLSRKVYEKLKGLLPEAYVKKLLPLRGKIFADQYELKNAIEKATREPLSPDYEKIIYPLTRDPLQHGNEIRHKKLKNAVKKYGFIEMRGGFEEATGFVNEKSLFIPSIPKKELIALGEKYKQCSVIYKDGTMFVEIGTGGWDGKEPKCTKGKILNRFKHASGKDNLSFNVEIIKMFFSRLLKGPELWRLTDTAVKVLQAEIELPEEIAEKLQAITNVSGESDPEKAVAKSFKTKAEIVEEVKQLIGAEAFKQYGNEIIRVADAKKFVFQLEESCQTPKTFYAYNYKSEDDIPFKVIYKG